MSGLFGGGSSVPKPPPPVPKPDMDAITSAGDAARRRERAAAGRASTMLTGGSLGDASVASKKLLGN